MFFTRDGLFQHNRSKRHIAVDTLSLLLTAAVHSTGIQDRVGARAALLRLHTLFTGIQTVFVGGYT